MARDFVEYLDGKSYSADSCRRKVADKIAKRRAELELNETGREESEDDWTIALDAWREVLNFYGAREDGKRSNPKKLARNQKRQIGSETIYVNEQDANELLIVQSLDLIRRRVAPIQMGGGTSEIDEGRRPAFKSYP